MMRKTISPLYHDIEDGVGHSHTHGDGVGHEHVGSVGHEHIGSVGHEHIESVGHEHAHDHIESLSHDHMHELGIAHSHDGHAHSHEHGEHGHVHSAESKKAVVNRLSRIIGHMQSVKTMVESDRDCSDVLIQLSAINSAVQSVSRVILKEHLSTCIIDAVQEGDYEAIDELNKAIDKFMK